MFEFEPEEVRAPYPGLRPFEAHEAEIFFGREAHTDRLLEILRRERFLAVLGPSGAGKSSLVRAGLLPALAAGWLDGSSRWQIAVLRPGDRPFRRLAEALVRSRPEEPVGERVATVEAELRRGPLGLAHWAIDARKPASAAEGFKLLVLVDQFEELFRYALGGGSEADESTAFVNLLLASRGVAEAEVYVALTMRTDYLGHCVRFLELPEAINRAQYLTPRLTRAELERAITGPALVFGGAVAPNLVTELINQLGQDFDQLPLLQHALARMWSQAPSSPGGGPTLTLESLRALGGLQGALSTHADQVFAGLSSPRRPLAEALFRAITHREGAGTGSRSIRRPQRLEQIAAVAGCDWRDLVPIVDAFSAEGVNFLHHEAPLGPASVIDISHEALIRQWASLRQWAEDEALQAAELRRWRDRAAMWQGERGELLSGADLARALEWIGPRRGPTAALWAARYLEPSDEAGFSAVTELIERSEEAESQRLLEAREREQNRERLEREALEAQTVLERERAETAVRERDRAQSHARRSRRLTWLAVATAVAALALALVAWRLFLRADRLAKESLARQLAHEATWNLEREPERAQLLAVEAFETAQLPVSDLAVRQAYLENEGLVRTLGGDEDRLFSMGISPDGRVVLVNVLNDAAQLWDAGTGHLLQKLQGTMARGWITDASFSPDGRIVLTKSFGNAAQLWDVGTGQLLHCLGAHRGWTSDAVFSPDSRVVLTKSFGDAAQLWDVGTGQLLATLGGVSDAVFSPDGRTVLTTSADKTARLWDVGSGELLRTLGEHQALVSSATFSPDGLMVLTTSADKTARLWDVGSGELLRTLREHDASVLSATFSPDGRTVLTTSADRTARLWGVGSGELLRTLREHDASVLSATFSPDGRTVLTTSADKTARLWDVGSGQLLQTVRERSLVRSAEFNPEGRTLLTLSDGTARLWVIGSDRLIRTLRGHAAFSPDGRMIFTSIGDKTVQLWDSSSGRLLQTLRGREAQVLSAVLSPDGRTVLTTSGDGTAQISDISSSLLLQALRGHEASISSVAFSADGRMILTSSEDKTARLWDSSSGHLLQTLRGHEAPILSAALSPDGRTVLTTSGDGSARLWDVGSGQVIRTLRRYGRPVTSAVFSPSGRTVLAVRGNTVELWDIGSGQVFLKLQHSVSFLSAVLRPDGREIATASEDNTARLWDASSGRLLQTLQGHEGTVSSASFSPDGRTVLTASDDNTARLWDSSTGQLLETLRGHEGKVWSAVFSPNGLTVLTASRDGSVRLWDCTVCRPTSELAEIIRRRIGRKLTAEERAQSGLPPVP